MRVIKESKNRETGTVIEVIDNRQGEFESGETGWVTHCVDHGNYCLHDQRVVALLWSSQPTMWCEDCQAAYSTDGKGSWNDFS